jgi:hypothetical protein
LILLFIVKADYAEEIPIIDIFAGKSAQSKGVLGSDIEIINSKTLTVSIYSNQLGDVIADNISGQILI